MGRFYRLLLLVVAGVQAGCVTPVAVRSLSAGLVHTQRVYAASLQGYFAAVETFAGVK